MTKPDLTETELDALFDAVQQDVPGPDDAFLRRLEADAAQAVLAPRAVRPAAGGFSLADLLGGWRGFGGLIAATVTGVWIGAAPPAFITDPLTVFDVAVTGASSQYDEMLGLGVPVLDVAEGDGGDV